MDRQRLTITIKKDLLKAVDQAIDGAKIRNRSHAIEFLLSQSLGVSRPQKALILAGGPGTKMRPLTYEMPKALLPVRGKPILEHILAMLLKNQIRDVIISIGYLGGKIKDYFGDGARFGVNITYIEEKKRLGSAGPLRLAKNFLTEPFLVMAGDTLARINLDDFSQFHRQSGGWATMALVAADDPYRYGVVRMRGTQILDFEEKPSKKTDEPKLINAGVYILDPKVISFVKPGFSMLEETVFPKLAREGKLHGYIFEGDWFHAGTPVAYQAMIKGWQKD